MSPPETAVVAHDWYAIVSPAIGAAVVALLGAIVVYANSTGSRVESGGAGAEELPALTRSSTLIDILMRIETHVSRLVDFSVRRDQQAHEDEMEARVVERLRREQFDRNRSP